MGQLTLGKRYHCDLTFQKYSMIKNQNILST